MTGVAEAQLIELLYPQRINNGPTSSWKVVFMRMVKSTVPGASVRNSACGKGHEEGSSAHAKAGSSLKKLSVPEHLPPKPESAYSTVLCSHLHL